MASGFVRSCHRYHSVTASSCRLKNDAYRIFRSGLDAVLPNPLVCKALQFDGRQLRVAGRSYNIHHNVKLAAFGKAVCGMVRAAEDTLGDHVRCGFASIPFGMTQQLMDEPRPLDLPKQDSRVV